MGYLNGFDMTYNWDPLVLTLLGGNYIGVNLATAIQDLLNGFAAIFDFEILYHPARGTITIEATSEGMGSHNIFYIPSDFGMMICMSSTDSGYPWKNSDGHIQTVEINNLKPINGVFKKHRYDYDLFRIRKNTYSRSYESGLIDLFNVHNVHLHCPNLWHFNSIGVRGENTIIKQIPVSSSFGYLIIDSVVAPHDKNHVSRQLIKTIQFSLRDVYGTVINLHGAVISFSLVFATMNILNQHLKLVCSSEY